MAATLEQWALPRIQQLLPLDEESLKQVVQYADTLPKDAAAEHLKNLLGDDAKALEFISAFNFRRPKAPASTQPRNHDRQEAPSSSTSLSVSEVPKSSRGGRGGKKKANIHALPARQVEGHGNVHGGYVKGAEDSDYMPKSARRQNERQTHKDTVAENMAIREERPDATKMPLITDDASATSKPITAKAPPSAAGALVGDSLVPKKGGSAQGSRNVCPSYSSMKIAGKTKSTSYSASRLCADSIWLGVASTEDKDQHHRRHGHAWCIYSSLRSRLCNPQPRGSD